MFKNQNNHFITFVKSNGGRNLWLCFDDGREVTTVSTRDIVGMPVIMIYKFTEFQTIEEIASMSSLITMWTREEYNNAQTMIQHSTENHVHDSISPFYENHLLVGHIQLLDKFAWINDEVVNGYMMLLKKYDTLKSQEDRSRTQTLFMSSHFIGILLGSTGEMYDYQRAKRWTKSRTKDVNIFSFLQIFLPINISNTHWAFAIVNIKDITRPPVQYFDSYFSPHSVTQNIWTQGITRWLNDEHARLFGAPFPNRRTQIASRCTIPQQSNTWDCGIFSLTTAEYIIRGCSEEQFDYSQKAMQFIRTKIAINLLRKSIQNEDASAMEMLDLISESDAESESDIESEFESESEFNLNESGGISSDKSKYMATANVLNLS